MKIVPRPRSCLRNGEVARDRKSTRLNSSHSQISYAVFCLKKKKTALPMRTTEHTSELQSQADSRSQLLLDKKDRKITPYARERKDRGPETSTLPQAVQGYG